MGIGAAIGAAAAASAASAGATAATAAAISAAVTAAVNIAISLAASFAIRAITSALSPAPDAPKLKNRREAQLRTVREPTRTRELVYGNQRKGGTFAFLGTTDEGQELHMVIALAGHRLNAIQEVYFDETLAFDASGALQPSFQTGGEDKAFLTTHLGEDDQEADTILIRNLIETTGSITGATQADPVVITSAGHGLSTDDTVYINDIGATLTNLIGQTATNLVSGTYRWIESASGTKEFYVELSGGGDRSLTDPASIDINGTERTEGNVGTLAAGEWDFGDNDSLGFNTVYVRLDDDDDPDNKASGFVEHFAIYQWTESASGTKEFYVELNGGGDPKLSAPDYVNIDGIQRDEGTLGSLAAGEWDYGDNDTLGFSTVYVRLDDDGDPDGEATDFVEHAVIGTDMTELNNREFRVDVLTNDTFELRDEDGTGHTAYSTGGTWAKRPWTTSHRLRGIAYMYVRLIFERAIYDGVPQVSAQVQGKPDVRDPRTETTGFSSNPALCLADYLTDSTFGIGVAESEISDADLIAAANVCDESVAHPEGTETRFTANGIVDSGELPRKNIEFLLSSMAGQLIYSGGSWIIKAGAHETPTLELNENDLRSNIQIQAKQPKREAFNAVRGTFVSAKNLYQPSDFPAVEDATALSDDNNERIWKDIELAFTETETMAQRLALIHLKRARQEIAVTATWSLKALELRAGDPVMLTIDRMGWSQKQFVVSDWGFVSNDSGDVPLLEIQMTLRETDSTIYDFDVADLSLIDDAPLVTIDNPGDGIALFTYQVEDLAAGADISPARGIRTSAVKETLTSANILSQGTAAGIDNANTCVITIYKNGNTISSLTFDTGTPFPADGSSSSFASLSSNTFSKNDVLKIEVVNGATADPPAFVLQAQMEEK